MLSPMDFRGRAIALATERKQTERRVVAALPLWRSRATPPRGRCSTRDEIRVDRVTALVRSGHDLDPAAARDCDCCGTNSLTPGPSHRESRIARVAASRAVNRRPEIRAPA